MNSILFDFGGTLDSNGASWGNRFYAIYKEAGVSAPRDKFDKAFYASDDGLPTRHCLPGLDLERTLELQVGDVLQTLAPDAVFLKEKLVDRFLRDCRAHFNVNRPILERLRKKYRLGIVSNFYGNLDSVLRGEGLRDLFETVADSGVVGVEKPAPALFLHALKELRCRPEDSIMVGDSIPRDMRAAEKMEMAHALITAAPETSCCPRAWTLGGLADLESRLS